MRLIADNFIVYGTMWFFEDPAPEYKAELDRHSEAMKIIEERHRESSGRQNGWTSWLLINTPEAREEKRRYRQAMEEIDRRRTAGLLGNGSDNVKDSRVAGKERSGGVEQKESSSYEVHPHHESVTDIRRRSEGEAQDQDVDQGIYKS